MAEKKDTAFVVRPTGINDLDEILYGGIPEGHVVLLSGNSGTGKTILAMQWLFEGYSRFQEPGVYITLTESITKAMMCVKGMAFYTEGMVDASQVHFTDLRSTLNLLELEDKEFRREDVEKILEVLENLIRESKAKRVVIDSITALAYMLKEKDLIRYFIFRLGSVLANLDCTILLTSEVSDGHYSAYGVEEFISDGIIQLDCLRVRDEIVRTLQVVKMRGVDFDMNVISFRINEKGVNLFLKLKTSLDFPSPTERISTGVEGIDRMCHGGIFKGSSTLIAGSTGTGKTLMCLQFVLEGLKNNKPCLYVGFEEGKEKLLRTAHGFGWNLKDYENQGLLTFLCSYPSRTYPNEHLNKIRNIVEKKKIQRVAVDSLSSVGNVLRDEDFADFNRNLVTYLNQTGVTTFLTAATATLLGSEMITHSNLSSLTDNIILLKYIEVGGELGFMVAVLKTRSSDRDKKLRSYTITSDGLVVGEPLSAYEGVMSGSAKRIGKTTEEKLREEFTSTLGPMGLPDFKEIQKQGASEENIIKYINTLSKEGILTHEDGVKFRERIFLIINGVETRGMEDENK